MLATGLTRFQKQQNHNQSALVSYVSFWCAGTDKNDGSQRSLFEI